MQTNSPKTRHTPAFNSATSGVWMLAVVATCMFIPAQLQGQATVATKGMDQPVVKLVRSGDETEMPPTAANPLPVERVKKPVAPRLSRVLELPARAVNPTAKKEVKKTVGKTIEAHVEAKLGDNTSEALAAETDVLETVKEQAKSQTKQSKQVKSRENKDAVRLTANTTKAASSDAKKTSMIQVASKHLVTRRQTTTNPKPAADDPINRLLSRESGPVVVFVGDGSNVSASSIQAKPSTELAKPVAGRAIPAKRKVSSQVPATVAIDSIGSRFPKRVPVPRARVGRVPLPLRSDAKTKTTDLVSSKKGKATVTSVGQHDQKQGAATPHEKRNTPSPTEQVVANAPASKGMETATVVSVADKTKDTVAAATKSKLRKSHDTSGVSASAVASKSATVSKDNDEQTYNSFSTFPVIRFVELQSGSAGRNAMTRVAPNKSAVAAAASKKPSLPLRAASKTNGPRRGKLTLLPAVADENDNTGFIPAPNSVVAKKLGDKPPVPGTPNQFTPLDLTPSSATPVVSNPTLSATVKPLGQASQAISITENTGASQKLSSALATQLVTQLPAEVTTLPLVPTALEPAPERVRAVTLESAREQIPKSAEIASLAMNPGTPILPQTQSTKPIAISRVSTANSILTPNHPVAPSPSNVPDTSVLARPGMKSHAIIEAVPPFARNQHPVPPIPYEGPLASSPSISDAERSLAENNERLTQSVSRMPAPAPNAEQHQTVLVANGTAGYPEPMMLGESIGRELESMTFQPSRLFAHEDTESLLTPSTWPCNRCGQRSCNCSTVRWGITAEAMFLHRSRADNTNELLLSEAGSGQGFRSRDLDLDFHGGPRFTLSRQSLNGGVDVEAIYYSIQEWSASENLAGDLVLKERLPIGISTGAINYESTLQNVELNASKFVTNWTQLLIGFRYLNLEEFSSIYTEGVTDFRQDATVRNDLTGGQIGLRKSLWDNGGFVTIDGSVKSGIYHSNIRRRVNGFAIDDLKKNDVAFVNEIDLALNYEITKAWSATFGYQAMWLTDVGLAADQFHSGAEIANDGTTFFHGLRAGINFSW